MCYILNYWRKVMKKTITSLMASTMILGQLGGVSALAEENDNIHIEEPVDFSDDLVEEAEDLSMEDTPTDSTEDIENSSEDNTDDETEFILFEDENPENEEYVNVLIDGHQGYDDDYYDDDDWYYYPGENPFTHITSLEVSMSTTEIAIGEKIIISIPIEDIPSDTMGIVFLSSNSGNTDAVHLDYDYATGQYKGIFDFFNSSFDARLDTVITVNYVELTDYISYESEMFYTDKGQLEAPAIYNNIEVPEGNPIINLDSIKVSSNEIFDNERIQVEAEINSEADLNTVEVYFEVSEYSGRTVELKRFKDTNLYVGFFRKFYSDESLDYNFKSIYARDIFGNETHLSAEDYDFSHLTINYNHVEEPAKKEASYVTDSLSISHSEAFQGDVVEYKLKLENLEAMHEVTLSLSNETTRNSNNLKLYYDYETDYFVGEWHVTDYDESGNYNPVRLYNHSGNNWFNHSFDSDYRKEHSIEITTAVPQFKINSIAFDKSEVEAGTINRLVLDIDTDEPVDLYLLGLSGYHVNIAAYYNAETGLYEAVVHTSGLFRNDIILEDLSASIEDRRLFIDLQDTDFNEVNFTIIPVEGDEERNRFSTTVDREAIKQSKSFVNAGETVTVTVPVADFSKIASGSVMYHTPLSNKRVEADFVYNEEKMVFEAIILTDETSENGWWQASQISFMDLDYNSYYIGTGSDIDAKLMSGLDFVLSGGADSGHIEPLTITSVEKNANSFEPGEEVKLAVEITNPRFESLQLNYRMPESRLTRVVKADFNDETGVYEASLTVSDHAESGRWVLEQIKASDNEIINDVPVLLDGNFNVENENSEVSSPRVNTEEYSASYDAGTRLFKVQTNVSGSEMVSRVTVQYRDITTDRIIYIQLTETNDTGVFEGVTRLQDGKNLDNIRLMTIDLIGHENNLLDAVRTTNLNPVTGVDPEFSEVVVASDEEENTEESDASPENPDDESNEDNESDTDLENEESESDDNIDEDDMDSEEDEHIDTEDDIDEDSDSDVEQDQEEADSGDDVEEDSNDSGTEEDEEDSTETDPDSDDELEENAETPSDETDYEESESDSEENSDTPRDETEEESDAEEDTTETVADSADDAEASEDESTSEDSDNVDGETNTEAVGDVESSEDSAFEQDAEGVDSATVLPDTATATWTIGMASFISLLSGLGIRFASKKNRKQ